MSTNGHCSTGVLFMQEKFSKNINNEFFNFTGAQIKAARNLLFWEQKYLAKVLDVSTKTLVRMESNRGQVNCSLKNAQALMKVFSENNIIFVNDENEVSVKLLKK